MAAPPRAARRILLAYSDDAGDAARTLRWAAAHVARPADRFSLVHVRTAEVVAPAATPVVEVSQPPGALPNADAADVAAALGALKAACRDVDAVQLRTVLRVSDALLSYLRFLPVQEKADALIMGSHGARHVGTALWKVPHTSLDVAAGNTVCPMFLARAREAAPPGAPRHVALAVDGASPGSTLLTRWALAHALRPTDAILLVNKCFAPDPSVEAEVGRCGALLADFVSRGGGSVATHHVGPKTDVRDFLVDLSETGMDARVGPPTLLVLGSRGERALGLKHLVLGSTAEYVVKSATTNLCVVPPLTDEPPHAGPV